MSTARDYVTSVADADRPVRQSVNRWLALGAVAGPALFTLAWFILGLVSPGYTLWDLHIEGYSPISQPVSGLGLGPTAAFMNTAFVLLGLLTIAGAVGIFAGISEMGTASRRTCTGLLALHGVGAIVDGIFTLESILVHFFGFLLALSPIVTFLIIGRALRKVPRWRRFGAWLLLGSPLTLILALLYFATFDPEAAGAGAGIGGLTQRLVLLQIHAWLVTMGWLAFRRQGSETRASADSGQRPASSQTVADAAR